MPPPSSENAPTLREGFPATHWSAVAKAAAPDNSSYFHAISDLCGYYWHPIYSYIRRGGVSPEQAEDLAQLFFADLLEHNRLAGIQREGGKFRSYLLTLLKRFLSHEREKARAQKRGGGAAPLSLDAQDSEVRYALEPKDDRTPDKLFERNWALGLLEKAMNELERDYARAGKPELYQELHVFLSGAERGIPYQEIGNRLGMSEANVKVSVHRLRKRYGELVRQEVARTVLDPKEIDAEIQALIAAAI